ncbi:23453_t:CDS:1, partial [Gigaspora rosea]
TNIHFQTSGPASSLVKSHLEIIRLLSFPVGSHFTLAVPSEVVITMKLESKGSCHLSGEG